MLEFLTPGCVLSTVFLVLAVLFLVGLAAAFRR